MSWNFENINQSKVVVNAGLRAYLIRVYNYMMGGLLVLAVCAFLSLMPPMFSLLWKETADGLLAPTLLSWIAMLSPLALIFMFGSSVYHLNAAKANKIFWIFSALMGVSLSSIALMYSVTSIFQAFLVTAGAFGGLSLYGYTTKRDLSGVGAFCTMGLIGGMLIILVNIFLRSAALDYFMSFLFLAIFIGLTAWDTQKIKNMYSDYDTKDMQSVKAISGALALYLDFINLFRLILYFLNDRR